MQGKKLYLKTFLTISVFSFFISYCIYVSSSYLNENVENVLSIRSHQLRRNAAAMDYNADTNHESLINKYVSNKNPRKYTNKYLKTINGRKTRRELLSISPTTQSNVISVTKYAVSKPKHYLTTKEQIQRSSFLRSLKLTKLEIQELERRTRPQQASKEWYYEKKRRLTSSSFGKAARLLNEEAKDKFVYFLIHGRMNKENNAYNQASEQKARKELQHALGREIRDAGLIVNHNMPYLATSPDGLVGKNGLVEIKIPPLAQNMTPQAALIGKKIKYCRLFNGRLHLKRQSNQYYQVQGQMHITNKTYCYFSIWTPRGIMFEIVRRNVTFWQRKMQGQLQRFYMFHMLPELIKTSKF